MDLMDTINHSHSKLLVELSSTNELDVKKISSLKHDYWRAGTAFKDEIIFDKYKRMIASDKYINGWKQWNDETENSRGTWKYIANILLNYFPQDLINVIKEYIRPLLVTEDSLRKIRVKRWMKNLSLAK